MTDFPLFPGGKVPDPNDPQWAAFMMQLQQMFSSPATPVNWEVARNVATTMAREGDQSLTEAERTTATDTLRLADVWLDAVTSLPSGVTTATGWSRLDWINETMATWKRLADPVASRVVSGMGSLLPEEMQAKLGGLSQILTGIGGMMFGSQLGHGLATLSSEVLSSSDIGLALGPAGTAALLPANLGTFTEGLERPAEEVRLYVALRECAHHRLFSHVAWVRPHLMNAVEAYARGITVNRDAFEEALHSVDPTDPETVQQALSGGVFSLEDTPEQQAALTRLETSLALIEGWVSHLVDSVAAERLPSAGALSETFRRRRAAGGPAEQTFANMVGLELRPRRLREAGVLWAALADKHGIEGRDATWSHPDLMPSAADLDDPKAFAERDNTQLPDWDDLND